MTLAALCDGHANCSAGDDETTPLCESEILDTVFIPKVHILLAISSYSTGAAAHS